MSFSAVACSADKGPDMFVQGCEDFGSDFFDQFLTYGPAEVETGDYPLPESTLMKRSESNSEYASLSLTETGNKPTVAPKDSWPDGTWATTERTVASHSASTDRFYASERAAVSDSELLSLEGIYLDSPRLPAHTQTSLPSSPTRGPAPTLRRKKRIVESLSKTFNRTASSVDKSALRSPIRKAKATSAMMRTSHQNTSSLDLWEQKFDLDSADFDFDFEQNEAPLSPPPSTRAPDGLQFSNTIDPQKGELLNGMSYKHALTQHMARSTPYDTPLSTPTLDRFPSRQTSQQLRLDNALFPVTPQAPNACSSWSQLPGSPDFNTYGNSTVYPEIDSPLWWNHAATAPLAHPSPTKFSNPQRASKSLALQLQNDLAFDNNHIGYDSSGMANGLMIQMPDTSAQQSFVLATPPMLPPQGYFSSPHSQPHQHQLHQHQQQHHQHVNHNRQASYHARSRHPQPSTPVRKSRSASSDSEPTSPNCSAPAGFHVRKRKTPKTSQQSTPRTPTTGSVDFVNYTPSDSRKILTGVAPSGSSKTKARREKEALDKRRKLSQAALRAVRAAGGDIDSLVEQGLFV
ncbi:hypothetical protein BKA64DRAFT_470032 [Cadophora sp. MPI-SDFR-AT-0126]|nr:hypothetical protein BKA64DRAFT_470032 [Leotiomycetes sp. MPI-SDFR-AT-0126]